MSDDDMGALRESDPVKWAALKGCEFAECVPVEEFRSPLHAEAWLHMRRMAKFIRRETTKGPAAT